MTSRIHDGIKKRITKTRSCNIQRFFTAVKNDNFQLKCFDYFHIFAQNIYCGCSKEYPQYMF